MPLKFKETSLAKYIRVVKETIPNNLDRLVIIVKTALDSAFPLLEAYLAAKVLNASIISAQQKKVTEDVFIFVGILIATDVLKRLFDFLFGMMSKRLEDEAELNIGLAISKKTSLVEYSSYEDPEFLKLAERVERFKFRAGFLTTQITNRILYPVFTFVTSLVAFLAISKLAALIIVAVSVPSFIYRLKLSKAERKLWNDTWSIRRKSEAYIDLSSPRYIKESRVLGIIEHARKKWWDQSHKIVSENRKLDKKNEKINIIDGSINTVIEYTLLIIVIYQIAAGRLEVGYFVFAQQLIGRFLNSIYSLSTGISIVDEDIAYLADFIKFMDLPEEEKSSLKEEDKLLESPSIKVKGLSFVYPNSKEIVLKNLDLDIPYGKNVAIVGENGSGKTTLVKVILGLYKPTKGEVFVNDHSVKDYSSSSWHKKVGVLFQDFNEFADFTIEDAVWFGDVSKPRSKAAINKALEQAGALGFVSKLESGTKTYMNKWVEGDDVGTELSGGQYQRIALARIFFRDPDILILDEPTSAIDAKGEYEIFKMLEEKRKGKTNIFISHRFNTVRKADIIYFVEDGKIIESGSHDDLVRLKGKYYDLFEKYAKDYR